MELIFDDGENPKERNAAVQGPTWEDIERAIRALDGARHTEVVLVDPAQLTIGGGCGQYFVSIFTPDEQSFVVTDESRSGLPRQLVVSGGRKFRFRQSVSCPWVML